MKNIEDNELKVENGNYTFVRETIKKTPPKIILLLFKILKVLGFGIVFGLGVCLVLVIFFDERFKELSNKEQTTQESKNVEEETEIKEEKKPVENIESSINSNVVDIIVVNDSDRIHYTGIIVLKKNDLFICTAYEKLENASGIYVSFDNGNTQSEAQLYGADKVNNVAIIKVKKANMTPKAYIEAKAVAVSSLDEMSSGEKIVFAGNPYGSGRLFYTGTLAGITGKCENFDDYHRIVITDIINEKVDDGFLFNQYGEVMAIITSKNTKSLDYKNISGISIEDIKYIYNALLYNTGIKHIGIKGEAVTDEMRKLTQEDIPDGLYITEVSRTSTAFMSGIMVGDIIVKANNTEIKSIKDIQNILDNARLNDKISVVIMRKIGTEYIRYEIDVQVSKEI